MMKIKKNQGFTLIELMIALAIVGLLMAIAAPGYQKMVRKGNRSDGVALAQELANELERYYVLNNKYPKVSDTLDVIRTKIADPLLGGANDHYSDSGYYKAALTNEAGICVASNDQCYVIELTARGGQAADGKMRLFSDGLKWRDFNNDGTWSADEKKGWFK